MATRTGLTSVLVGVPEALRASLRWPGDAFRRLLAALGPSGASPDRLWGVIGASTSRPERVRTRPRNGFGRPNQPKIDFSLIFRRLRFRFCGFPMIFRRAIVSFLFILFSALHLRNAGQPHEDCARATKREAKRAGFALRSPFRCSSLLARLPRFTSQVAS